MSFPDIVPELKAKMPELRGRLLANQSLGEFTWFRVGGPAQVFYMPEDENDLAYFLRNLPPEIPRVVSAPVRISSCATVACRASWSGWGAASTTRRSRTIASSPERQCST
jgi:UDP-N-acetylmuramate dehydrogenase